MNALKSNNKIELFKDVFFTPILIDELASKAHLLIDMDAKGIYNIVGNERLSKYEFGLKLANLYELDVNLAKSINFDDKTDLVRRPKDMSLSNRKLCDTLKCEIPSIDEQILRLKNQEESKINALNQVSVDIIPYGMHHIDEDDVAAVVEVLRNGMLTQGPKVYEFETKVANYVGAKYAVAVSSGTAALEIAIKSLNLKKGDEIIIPNFTIISNALAAIGFSSMLLWILFGIGISLRTSTQTVTSRRFGEENFNRCGQVLQHGHIIALFLDIV